MSRSETMKKLWQDPEFRKRQQEGQKKGITEWMKRRFLEIQKEGS